MKRIEIKAPAKINIGLNIVSKRNDGYHNLETFFYPIHDLFDYITFKISDSFSFYCSLPDLDNDNNLIVKAVKLLEDYKKTRFNIDISCKKEIPNGAGLGGGSSDAAATLICMNELFQLNIKYEELVTLALFLGSDVPFFLKSKPAIGKSRGEILKHVELEIPKYIMLVNPLIHISTKEAFSKITPAQSNINYDEYFQNNVLDYTMLSKNIKNDFEESVFTKYPEIKNIKEIMLANGACLSLMSGSGSTVFGLFDDLSEAENVKKHLPGEYFTFISMPDNYFH